MALPLVQPGDLISAAHWRLIADTLNNLEARVVKLENATSSAAQVRITGVTGPSPLRVGDPITVLGAGFLVPPELNDVRVGGVGIAHLSAQSSPTRLGFDLPMVLGLTELTGTPVLLEVSNQNGKDSFTISLRPPLVVPQGRVTLAYKTAPSDPTIVAGNSLIFGFELTPILWGADAQVLISPSVGSGWTAELLQDAIDNPRPSKIFPITLANSGKAVPIRVRINVPGTAGGSATVHLAAAEITTGSQVSGSSFDLSLTVGQAPPPVENRVTLSLVSASLAAQITGSGVTVTKNASLGIIKANLAFKEAGNYNLSVAIKDPTGWSDLDIDQQSVAIPAGGGNLDASVTLSAGNSAAATNLVLTATRTSPTPGFSLPLIVQLSIA